MSPNAYVPPATNVFQATEHDRIHLGFLVEVGKWYFFEIDWKTLQGPFDCQGNADRNFQNYARSVKFCPTGGCED